MVVQLSMRLRNTPELRVELADQAWCLVLVFYFGNDGAQAVFRIDLFLRVQELEESKSSHFLIHTETNHMKRH